MVNLVYLEFMLFNIYGYRYFNMMLFLQMYKKRQQTSVAAISINRDIFIFKEPCYNYYFLLAFIAVSMA